MDSEESKPVVAASPLLGSKLYRKKYHILRKEAERIQRTNEILVNRLFYVKKYLRRVRKERSFLITKLEKFNDNFFEAEIPAFWEEGNVYKIIFENPDGLSTLHPPPAAPPPPLHPANDRQFMQEASQPVRRPNNYRPDRKKKPEKTEDGAPRRPINAYFMFCQDNRRSAQDEHYDRTGEDLSKCELTKLLGSKWQQLTADEKQVFADRYQIKKQEYDVEMKAYRAKLKEATLAAKKAPAAATGASELTSKLKSEVSTASTSNSSNFFETFGNTNLSESIRQAAAFGPSVSSDFSHSHDCLQADRHTSKGAGN